MQKASADHTLAGFVIRLRDTVTFPGEENKDAHSSAFYIGYPSNPFSAIKRGAGQ